MFYNQTVNVLGNANEITYMPDVLHYNCLRI